MSSEELTHEQDAALAAIDEQHRDAVRGVAERLWREEPKSAEHEINSIRPRHRVEVVAVIRAFRPVAKDKREVQFDKLRTAYMAAKTKLDAFASQLASKYGDRYPRTWLKSSESTKLDRLRESADKHGDAFTDYVASFSPRDWSYGVPDDWVRESLAFADAARHVNEQLSVVPPMAYGATRPRT